MRYVQHVSTFLLLAAGFLLYASANADVKEACEIQERLTLLGLDPGPIDGVVGNKTKDAVSSFLAQIETQKKEFTGEEVVSLLRRFKRINAEGNEIKASIPTVNRPMNGKEFFDIPQNSIAPLKIRTADQGYDYYIKLSNIDTGGTVKTVYVRSGSAIKVKVPLGRASLKYATGTQWLGKKCLFGIYTILNQADRVFEFKQSEGQISGFTVELILQKDGNLATKKIRADEW